MTLSGRPPFSFAPPKSTKTTNLVQMFEEPLCRLQPLTPLCLQHDAQGFPRLVRTEFIDEVMNLDEQQRQVVYFFSTFW